MKKEKPKKVKKCKECGGYGHVCTSYDWCDLSQCVTCGGTGVQK